MLLDGDWPQRHLPPLLPSDPEQGPGTGQGRTGDGGGARSMPRGAGIIPRGTPPAAV